MHPDPLGFCFCFLPPSRPLQIAGPLTYREIKNGRPEASERADSTAGNISLGSVTCSGMRRVTANPEGGPLSVSVYGTVLQSVCGCVAR